MFGRLFIIIVLDFGLCTEQGTYFWWFKDEHQKVVRIWILPLKFELGKNLSRSWHGFMISFLFTKLGLAPIILQAHFVYLRNMHWKAKCTEATKGKLGKKYLLPCICIFPIPTYSQKFLIKSLKVQNPIVI